MYVEEGAAVGGELQWAGSCSGWGAAVGGELQWAGCCSGWGAIRVLAILGFTSLITSFSLNINCNVYTIHNIFTARKIEPFFMV